MPVKVMADELRRSKVCPTVEIYSTPDVYVYYQPDWAALGRAHRLHMAT
jgi:hypothetical protein